MQLAITKTRAMVGMQAPEVTVEVHLSLGLPGFAIVGLPEAAVRESKDRVRSAIINSNFEENVNITVCHDQNKHISNLCSFKKEKTDVKLNKHAKIKHVTLNCRGANDAARHGQIGHKAITTGEVMMV